MILGMSCKVKRKRMDSDMFGALRRELRAFNCRSGCLLLGSRRSCSGVL